MFSHFLNILPQQQTILAAVMNDFVLPTAYRFFVKIAIFPLANNLFKKSAPC